MRSHVPIFSVDAGKLDAFNLSCAATDPAAGTNKHFSTLPPLFHSPSWSKLSQLGASDAGAEDVLCANCKVIRFNKEGVFLRVKPRGLGSSKGLKGTEEGTTDTGGIIGGSIRLLIFFFFLVSDG